MNRGREEQFAADFIAMNQGELVEGRALGSGGAVKEAMSVAITGVPGFGAAFDAGLIAGRSQLLCAEDRLMDEFVMILAKTVTDKGVVIEADSLCRQQGADSRKHAQSREPRAATWLAKHKPEYPIKI